MPLTELATSAALSTNISLHSRSLYVAVLALSLGRLRSFPYTSSVRLMEADSSPCEATLTIAESVQFFSRY